MILYGEKNIKTTKKILKNKAEKKRNFFMRNSTVLFDTRKFVSLVFKNNQEII